MRINRISLYNYRIYRGANQIHFEEDPIRNIHVVSGFNGFGKTSLLTSLVWCLYGVQMQEVDESFKKRIKDIGGYPKFLEDSLHRSTHQDFDATNYYVEISFSGVDIPGIVAEELTIRRSFSLGERSDTLQIWLDGQPNELVQEVGYDLFIQDFILPKEVARFFFFDAEKITELAEVQSIDQKRQLGKAYAEVLGIKKYTDLRASLREQRIKYRKRSANDNETKTLDTLEQQISDLEIQLTQQQILLEAILEDIEKTTQTINELQEKLIRAGNVISVEEHEGLIDKKKHLLIKSEELKESFKKLLDLAPFAIAGALFNRLCRTAEAEKNTQDQTSLEKLLPLIADLKRKSTLLTRELSKDQFHQLLQPLISQFEHIQEQTDTRDQQINIGLSNKAIHIIEHIEEQLHHEYQEDIKLVTRDMKRNRYELNETNRLLAQAESKSDDVMIIRTRDNLQDYQQKLSSYLISQGKTEEKIAVLFHELNSKKKVLEELQKKVNLQSDLLEKDAVAKRLINQLDVFIGKIKEQKKTTLQSRIKTTFQHLMHKSNFVDDVRIQIENEVIDVDLINKEGKVIHKEGLSMGEKQLYATAILYALVQEANFDFPVFIDSPMQKLDATHAQNIIQHFYPTVSKQVILLPLMHKEMSEKEFALLEPNVKSVHLIHHQSAESYSTFMRVDSKELFEKVNTLYENGHV